LDRFRVQSLMKLLQSGILKPKQAEATRIMLKEKCQILSQGALKRGKREEAEHYLKLAKSEEKTKL